MNYDSVFSTVPNGWNCPRSWFELGGVGWEWVWRGYNFGYKTAILGFLGETGFS